MTEASPPLQPLYLFADSQLLFWQRSGRLVLDAALDGLAWNTPIRAAYVGASNGDRLDFYEIFEAAMDAIGIAERRMIASSFGPADRAFLECAQLIVLAGGDVHLGWVTLEETGMKDVILDRYAKGAVLVAFQPARCNSDVTASARHLNRRRSRCSGSSIWSSTRTTSAPGGRGCRARFICSTEQPLGSGSPPAAESSCTRMPPSSRCGRPAHEFRSGRGRIAHSLLYPE